MAVGEMNVPATQQWGKQSYLRHSSGGKNPTCDTAVGERILPATQQWGKESYLRHSSGERMIHKSNGPVFNSSGSIWALFLSPSLLITLWRLQPYSSHTLCSFCSWSLHAVSSVLTVTFLFSVLILLSKHSYCPRIKCFISTSAYFNSIVQIMWRQNLKQEWLLVIL